MRRLKHSSKWSLAALVVLVLCGAVVGLVPGSSDAVPIATTKATSSSVELATVSNGRVVVKLDQFPQGGNPGDPLLPYKLVRVVVAPDTDLETVSAELTSGDWEELAGEHEVAAAPPAVTWNGEKYVTDWCGKDESKIIDGRDLAVYGNNAYFPAEAVEVVSVGQFRQWKVVEYRVWLAAYNPVSGGKSSGCPGMFGPHRRCSRVDNRRLRDYYHRHDCNQQHPVGSVHYSKADRGIYSQNGYRSSGG